MKEVCITLWLGLMRRVSPGSFAELWQRALVSGFGGFSTIYLLADSDHLLEKAGLVLASSDGLLRTTSLLIAPFGASCVLVFACPNSPLAQPRNVVGGHFVSSLLGIVVLMLLGNGPLALAVGVGLAIAVMYLTDTVHPPAGADPIVVLIAGSSWQFLLMPVISGTVIIVLCGVFFHRVISGFDYPARNQ